MNRLAERLIKNLGNDGCYPIVALRVDTKMIIFSLSSNGELLHEVHSAEDIKEVNRVSRTIKEKGGVMLLEMAENEVDPDVTCKCVISVSLRNLENERLKSVFKSSGYKCLLLEPWSTDDIELASRALFDEGYRGLIVSSNESMTQPHRSPCNEIMTSNSSDGPSVQTISPECPVSAKKLLAQEMLLIHSWVGGVFRVFFTAELLQTRLGAISNAASNNLFMNEVKHCSIFNVTEHAKCLISPFFRKGKKGTCQLSFSPRHGNYEFRCLSSYCERVVAASIKSEDDLKSIERLVPNHVMAEIMARAAFLSPQMSAETGLRGTMTASSSMDAQTAAFDEKLNSLIEYFRPESIPNSKVWSMEWYRDPGRGNLTADDLIPSIEVPEIGPDRKGGVNGHFCVREVFFKGAVLHRSVSELKECVLYRSTPDVDMTVADFLFVDHTTKRVFLIQVSLSTAKDHVFKQANVEKWVDILKLTDKKHKGYNLVLVYMRPGHLGDDTGLRFIPTGGNQTACSLPEMHSQKKLEQIETYILKFGCYQGASVVIPAAVS
jgi:hypothetical protein